MFVPTRAQMRETRGPLAALLILVGLLFSAGAVSSTGIRDGSVRLGSARQGSAPSLVRASEAASAADEATPDDVSSFVPPPEPRVVFERLALRPADPLFPQSDAARARPATASYRARAPPAV